MALTTDDIMNLLQGGTYQGQAGTTTSTAQLTPEQQRLLAEQTAAYTGTILPGQLKAFGGAEDVYRGVRDKTAGALTGADKAFDQGVDFMSMIGRRGMTEGFGGLADTASTQLGFGRDQQQFGADQMKALYTPEYKRAHIEASLLPAMETARDLSTQQAMSYGGAGQMGSYRQALADANLESLNTQRLAAAAQQAAADVENRRMQAAGALMSTGQTAMGQGQQAFTSMLGAGTTGITGAQESAMGKVDASSIPQDQYSAYLAQLYGIPQSSLPQFAGTGGKKTTSVTGNASI